MSWQIGPLPLQPHFVRGPPRPLSSMSSEVQKRGKLVREVGGPKDKTNGRERDALSWHFLSRPLPGVPFWPSPSKMATPAEPRGEFYFCANFGWWKAFRKCRWESFKRRERGLKRSDTFRIVSWILCRVFQTIFRIDLKCFSRAISFCRRATLTNPVNKLR